jgi:hypothetical protein
MRRPIIPVLILVLACYLHFQTVNAQSKNTTLQPGITIENELSSGQSHRFTINLEESQFVQLVVNQRGIDVIVRVSSPEGKTLGEFDSPNGNEGPENVSFVSVGAGSYNIDVSPLGRVENPAPGRYEIKILELRPATDEELAVGKNREVLKTKGLALLAEVAEGLVQIRLPQTRVRAQLQTAQLLWQSDEKLATKLAVDAAEGVKEYIAGIESSERDYFQMYALAMQLRQEVVAALGPHDPEAALNFLRSTRTLKNPNGRDLQWEPELQIELSLAAQLAAADPKAAMRIAQDVLKRGYPSQLLEIMGRLRSTEPEMASQLAKDIVAKLMNEKLVGNQEASNLAVNILRFAHSPMWRNQRANGPAPGPKQDVSLLSDQEYKDLLQHALSEALAYKGARTNQYSPEWNSAQNILMALNSMKDEVNKYAPEQLAVVEKKSTDLNAADSRGAVWQKVQQLINTASPEAVLEEIARSPRDIRDSLYGLLAQKVATNGDVARARQIVKDQIEDPQQRLSALASIEQQVIQMEASKGRIEEALRTVNNLRTARERASMLSQIASQIGPGLKRAQALELLEQARSMLGPSPRVESQEQMAALLEIALAFSRYDSKRAFEIVEPLLDQFNEISAAALVLNGFGQECYQDGELQMLNGNPVANVAMQLVQALSTLTPGDFDRAKAGADRLERQEIRLAAYLGIARRAINPDESVNFRGVRSGRINSRTIIMQ